MLRRETKQTRGNLSSRVFKGGLSDKITFDQNLTEGSKPYHDLVEGDPVKENSKCKGPEGEGCLACLRTVRKLEQSELAERNRTWSQRGNWRPEDRESYKPG